MAIVEFYWTIQCHRLIYYHYQRTPYGVNRDDTRESLLTCQARIVHREHMVDRVVQTPFKNPYIQYINITGW